MLAHMWLNLAAANFPALKTMHVEERPRRVREVTNGRDQVASKMTPAQVAEAQKLAREWKPTKQPPR